MEPKGWTGKVPINLSYSNLICEKGDTCFFFGENFIFYFFIPSQNSIIPPSFLSNHDTTSEIYGEKWITREQEKTFK